MLSVVKMLPIAGRELRVAARRRGTYWVRFLAAGVGMGCSSVILLAMMQEPLSAQAQVLTGTLAVLGFVYALFAGLLSTADCVSEEKREGTLGLLFLTDLRGYDVVAGKVVAHSIRAVSALVALVPLLWLPVLMGAVTGTMVWTLVFMLGNTMFLALAFGVLVSSVCRDAQQAVGGSVLLLAVLVVGVPFVRWLIVEYAIRPPANTTRGGTGLPEYLGWVLLANPAMLFLWAQEALFRGANVPGEFWTGFWVQHAMAWASLAGASWAAPRFWQDRGGTGGARVRSPRGPDSSATGDPAVGESTPATGDRADLLDSRPFGWIVARERRSAVVTWVGLGVVGLVWIWGFAEVKEDWLQGIVGLWTVFFAALWLKIRLAMMACRHLHEHRRSGALELVLCTAQTSGDIVAGNLAGLRRLLFPPLAVLLAGAALLGVAGAGQERAVSTMELLSLFGGLVGTILLDLWAIAWGGMWLGLRSAKYVRALVLTAAWVLLLPWAGFVVSIIVIGVSVETLGLFPGFNPSGALMIGWWVALSVGADVWLVVRSRTGLNRRLRELALDHYGAGPPSATRQPTPVGVDGARSMEGG